MAWLHGVLQAPPELQQSIEEGVNVTGEFCSLDATGKRVRERTMGEMEQVRQKERRGHLGPAATAYVQLGCIRWS